MFSLLPLFAAIALAADTVYEYRGPGGAGQYSAVEIGAFLRADAAALHEVRLDGFDDWQDATRVPEIAGAWLRGDGAAPVQQTAVQGAAPPERPAAGPRTEAVEAPATPAAPEALEAPALRGAGELWLNVQLPTDGEGASAAVRKAAVGFALARGAFTAKLLVAGERPGTVRLDDAWVGVATDGPVKGWARLGVARPGFGVADRFEEERQFWVAGRSAELERRSGWLPQSSAALAAGATGARWSASAELADAGAAAPAPTFAALEARGRGVASFGGTPEAPRLRLGASAAYRAPLADDASSRLLGGVHAELSAGAVHLFGEGIVGTEAEGTPLAGGLGAMAVTVPLVSPALRSFVLVLAGGGWDPAITGLADEEDAPDAKYEARAGANLLWNTPDSSLLTGVGYLLDVPQSLALAVTQTVVVEAAWRY